MFSRKYTVSTLLLMFCLATPILTAAQQYQPKDSITIAISAAYDSVSKSHRFFFGESYRKLWATPVKMRIVNLQQEKGGMKVTQLGGGKQTRSVRLEDASGREWVLRTIQKYPERGLPENLRATIAKDILQDQISTGHPYSSLIVPPLAEALSIPHADPEVVYVGDDPGLGEYRKDFANSVYLLEARWPIGFEKSDNTLKVKRKVEEDNDTHVDQKLVLRSRLLDFVVGDWDRHEDNWRWLKQEDKKKDEKVYIPVPRDRDKVMYSTSGLFPWILSHQWLKANLQPYTPEIRAVDQWNYNQSNFDRYFLNSLSEKDWKEEVKYVQAKLNPELLKKAMQLMPANIYAKGGEVNLQVMIQRTANLEKSALDYYRFLSKTVEIPASDKKEYFAIKHQNDGDIELTASNIKKSGELGRKLFHRTFHKKDTKEIRIYGMGGEDVFDVSGNTQSPIVVRMIGGDDKDEFKLSPALHNRATNFVYDRSDEDNSLPAPAAAKLRLSKDTTVNQYKPNFIYDQFGPLFHLNYNIDQGVQLGAGLILQKQGFRKYPYANKQELWADYSTGRKSFILTYAGDFKKVVGNTDLRVNAKLLGPNNLSNFFGLGNETAFIQDEEDDDKGMSYYRNRYDYLTADFQLYQKLGKWTVGAGLATEYYTSSADANDERFLHEFNLSNPEASVFDDRMYAGIVAEVYYDSRDNIAIPKKGMYWNTRISANQQLNREHDSYGKIQTEFRYYINPGHSGFVIANRLGGGTTVGDPQFFQLMQLGGVHNLRGFHTNRFSGRSMVYNNLDFRLKLFDFTSYIVPGSLGLLGFNDVGRVWQPGQSSDQWHYGYGGGIYIVPADLILIQAAVGFSRESTMPYISVGFNF
jgi:hypothetical protein